MADTCVAVDGVIRFTDGSLRISPRVKEAAEMISSIVRDESRHQFNLMAWNSQELCPALMKLECKENGAQESSKKNIEKKINNPKWTNSMARKLSKINSIQFDH